MKTQAIFPLNLIFEPFTFLDIGCSTPGNSVCYPLLQLGCDGYFVDIEDFDGWDRMEFHKLDATKTNWDFIDKKIDYLSIDADKDSYKVLENVPLEKFGVKVITIEHDAYWGLLGRAENRDLMCFSPTIEDLNISKFSITNLGSGLPDPNGDNEFIS